MSTQPMEPIDAQAEGAEEAAHYIDLTFYHDVGNVLVRWDPRNLYRRGYSDLRRYGPKRERQPASR